MYKDLIRIPTLHMSREDWVQARKGTIGGSDAAALVGLTPYRSPYSVWAEKTGRIAEPEDNEAMRQGRDLEDYVARRFTEATGKKVRRENAILKNPRYPFAHANVDRLVVGEDAGLECKTASALSLKKFKNGEFPANYYAQCVHYMAVTGAQRWYLAVVILGKGFEWFVIERDEGEIEALMDVERDFYPCIENDVLPPVDGRKATGDVIDELRLANPGEGSVELFGRDELFAQWQRLCTIIKDAEADKEHIRQLLTGDLGDAQIGLADGWRVSWTPQSKTTFDTKRLFADHPDIDPAKYAKKTQYMKFKITEAR